MIPISFSKPLLDYSQVIALEEHFTVSALYFIHHFVQLPLTNLATAKYFLLIGAWIGGGFRSLPSHFIYLLVPFSHYVQYPAQVYLDIL